ncbi:MAG: hypothetical protein ACI3ZQ_03465 [Candidatus Cryptobacteroides sp.]
MKNKAKTVVMLFAAIACTICLLTACEKHDGVCYLKSKCTAELNGQTYIDQLPLTYIFAVEGQKTPSFAYSDGIATFRTALCKGRGEAAVYYVDIFLFTDSLEELHGREVGFERRDIEYVDGKPAEWEYEEYCNDNRLPYAKVFSCERMCGEIADKGTFRLTSDKNGNYSGTFILQFSEGTMKGEFFF